MNFAQACRELGIPEDRAGLVRRNIELKGKLNAALTAITAFQEAWHVGRQHVTTADTCPDRTCAQMLKIVNELRAS